MGMISTVDHKDKPALSEGIIQYNNRLAPLLIRNTLHSIIPNGIEHIYVAGIGSNVISEQPGAVSRNTAEKYISRSLDCNGQPPVPFRCSHPRTGNPKCPFPKQQFCHRH